MEVSVVSLTPHLLPCHIILLTLSARQCASDWCAATRARIDFITTATAMPIQQRHGQAHHERLTTDKAIVRQQRDAPSTGAQKPTGQRQTHGYPSWRPVGGLPNARRKCPKVGVRRRSVAAWTCQRARAVTEVDWTHPFPGDCAGQTRTNACAHACKTAALPLLRHRLGPRTSARSETTANRTNTHRSTHPSHTDRQRHRQGHTYTQTDTHTHSHTSRTHLRATPNAKSAPSGSAATVTSQHTLSWCNGASASTVPVPFTVSPSTTQRLPLNTELSGTDPPTHGPENTWP